MKVLIDAYNLFHAAKRQVEAPERLTVASLIATLDAWTRQTRHEVLLVFDGKPPPTLHEAGALCRRLGLQFVGPTLTADAAIIEFLTTYSAPRTLLIVSSDRQIRRAAKKRGSKMMTSDEFWTEVSRKLSRRRPPREPMEKRRGLAGDQSIDDWIREFGLDEQP